MDGRAWKIPAHTEERRYRSGSSIQIKMRSCADTTGGSLPRTASAWTFRCPSMRTPTQPRVIRRKAARQSIRANCTRVFCGCGQKQARMRF